MNTTTNTTAEYAQIETNPVTGDQLEIVRSAMLFGGGMARIRVVLAPQSKGAPPLHYHRVLQETFTVEQGVLFVQVGKEQKRLTVGESIEILPGTPHRFWNPDKDTAVTFMTEATPGVEFERFLRTVYRLAREGKTNAAGMPRSLMQMIQIIEWGDIWFVGVPVFAQRLIRSMRRGLAQFLHEANRIETIAAFL